MDVSKKKGVKIMAKDERKSIIIRVNPELHVKLKVYTAQQQTNLQDYIVGLIEKDLKEKEIK